MVVGHQSKEHQAELEQSEVLEMEANPTRYLSMNVATEPSLSVEEGDCRASWREQGEMTFGR